MTKANAVRCTEALYPQIPEEVIAAASASRCADELAAGKMLYPAGVRRDDRLPIRAGLPPQRCRSTPATVTEGRRCPRPAVARDLAVRPLGHPPPSPSCHKPLRALFDEPVTMDELTMDEFHKKHSPLAAHPPSSFPGLFGNRNR